MTARPLSLTVNGKQIGPIDVPDEMMMQDFLHEYLPLYEDGPGDGTWNWDRYHLPRASEVAVWNQTADVLPARSAEDPPKGMAEVTVIAILPAIANAVAHAIGHRFYEMPITPDKIRGALS